MKFNIVQHLGPKRGRYKSPLCITFFKFESLILKGFINRQLIGVKRTCSRFTIKPPTLGELWWSWLSELVSMCCEAWKNQDPEGPGLPIMPMRLQAVIVTCVMLPSLSVSIYSTFLCCRKSLPVDLNTWSLVVQSMICYCLCVMSSWFLTPACTILPLWIFDIFSLCWLITCL